MAVWIAKFWPDAAHATDIISLAGPMHGTGLDGTGQHPLRGGLLRTCRTPCSLHRSPPRPFRGARAGGWRVGSAQT